MHEVVRWIVRLMLRIAWAVVLLIGLLILAIFLQAQAEDLSYAVLANQLTAYFGTPSTWIFIGGMLIALSLFLRSRLRRMIQARSDGKALKILEDISQGNEAHRHPYFLYLRAFETTGKLKAPWFMFAHDLGLQQIRSYELEGFLASALRKSGPLIALGEPGEHLGAGRILTTEENWQSIVQRLAKNSKGILLIPSDRPGTLWEIQYLRLEGLLSKTIFIMPPEARGFDWRAQWQQGRRKLGDFGAALPEYQQYGLMFSMDEQGNLKNASNLSILWPRGFRKSVERFLTKEARAANPEKLVAKGVAKARRRWRFGALNALPRIAGISYFAYAISTAQPILTPSDRPEAWSTLFDRFQAVDELQRMSTVNAARFMFDEGFAEMAASMTPEQRDELQGEVTIRGLSWSVPDSIRAYFSAMAAMITQMNPSECRAFITDQLNDADFNKAMIGIEPDKLRAFTQATALAIKAGLEHSNPVEVTEAEIEKSAEQFSSGLTPTDYGRYVELENEAITTIGGEDLCWLLKTTFSGYQDVEDKLLNAYSLAINSGKPLIVRSASKKTALEQLIDSPHLQERIAGLDEDAIGEVIGRLINAGLSRLDDKELLSYFGILWEIVLHTDEEECIALATDQIAASSTKAFEALSPATKSIWEETLYTAARLEVEEQPAPALKEEVAEAAADSFIATLKPDEVTRLNRFGTQQEDITDDDICWIYSKKIEAATLLSTPQKEAWARSLIQGRY